MAIFTTDLSDFLIPKISDYEPDFGTMKQSGGLTTKEVSENIMYPLLAQRGFNVTETSSTSATVERDSKFIIIEPNVTLTIGTGIDGIKTSVFNRSGGNANVVINNNSFVIPTGKRASWEYVLDKWENPIDSVHPIGEIYVQYPTQASPNDLFIGTHWDDVSNLYGGLFFRVFKQNVTRSWSDTEVKEQDAQLPNIKGHCTGIYGELTTAGALQTFSLASKTNSFGWDTAPQLRLDLSKGEIDAGGNYKTNSTYVDGGEVRPRNTAIRIFKRTS